MKIMTVVGARPEFIQMAPVTRALRRRHQEVIVHTGQHYDDNMSDVFFSELKLPKPDYHLDVGAGSHAGQTGAIMVRIEQTLQTERPDWLVVFGDTNSTLGAALAAAKLGVPVAHIEAGLRSYDRRMPEEINRVVTDHVSGALFAPTVTAVENLKKEGIERGVHLVGDVRVDLILGLIDQASRRLAPLLQRLGLAPSDSFALATIHRASNTDDASRLRAILAALGRVELPVVLPVHPRLSGMMKLHGLGFPANVVAAEPLGVLDLVSLLHACRLVLTDSGGLQKEAYMLSRPTLTLRDTTEWPETIEAGWNRLCEPDPASFEPALARALEPAPSTHPDCYGAPGVCDRISEILELSPSPGP